jgi:hypothetical protein
MLAASYAAERGLTVTALVPDFGRFPVDAVERRDAFLVADADAVVVVWDGRDESVRRVRELPDGYLVIDPDSAPMRRCPRSRAAA